MEFNLPSIIWVAQMPSDPAKLDFELLVKVQTMRFIINQYNYTETVYFQGYSDFWTL